MKKFVIKILYFILPIIISAYPLDYGISYFLRQSNQSPGEFEVMNDIYSSRANYDVAIYGSSRAWVHFDPEIISDSLNLTAYNFGIDGHNFWLQYLRHLELLKYNEKPKIIILSVDIFTLQKRIDLYGLDQFLPYMLWNKNIKDYTSSYIGYDNLDYYVPLIRYAGKSQALKTSIEMLVKSSSNKRYRNKGYLGKDIEWTKDFKAAKIKENSYDIKFDIKSIELFETFIKECEELDIKLVLVYTPEYFEGQNFISNRAEMMDIFKSFSKKYDLIFYDYSNDEICLDKNLFYNVNHLNKTGSERFSKIFVSDLKSKI